ncbi:MAG: hypothetical protein JW699_01380 [Chitinispirillaceae bacterium]|nr:hypothetical protein [Chitinispirillaceae bacterium]
MRKGRSVFVLAVVLIAAGAALTLENMGFVSGAGRLWPAFVLVLGAGFLILFFNRGKNDPALLFIGTVVSLLSVFFFYLNLTGWSHMSKLWPVFLGIAGAGFLAIYLERRLRLFLLLSVALVMLAGVFYLVFGVSLHLWPLSLVAFGLSLLAVNHYYLRR